VKGNEKTVIAGAIVFVLAVAFYMLVLSPKRAEVSELDSELTSLDASIAEQQQLVSFGEQARKDFPGDYSHLVVLGKAVPDSADTASLMVELSAIATQTNTDFRGIVLSQGGGEGSTAAAAPPPAPAPAAPAEGEAAAPSGEAAGASGTTGSTTSTTSATTPTATPVPATEASAANLPIGATVGTAGLPTLPYTLTFTGGFFGIADYIGQLDDLVHFEGKGNVKVNGRLMTVDGFALKGGEPGSNPILDASFALTSYVTPSTQGLTAGATPTGPAPGAVQATPASATVAP
jgi:hypothetical protein